MSLIFLNILILAIEWKKIEEMSCYGGKGFSIFATQNFGAAKRSCESDLNCLAIKHIECGNNVNAVNPYSTCSVIGIRTENEILEADDKKNCIYEKITGGMLFRFLVFKTILT